MKEEPSALKERIRQDFLYWNETPHTEEEMLEYWLETVSQAYASRD